MSNRVFHPEVSRAIEDYFENRHITQAMAAKLLDVTPQAVSLQLKQPFGKNVSSKWSRTFGFNKDFLMTGKGVLITIPILTKSEQEIYDAANSPLNHINDDNDIRDINEMIPKELEIEDAEYRRIDIDQFVTDSPWDTNNDYNLAVQILNIHRVKCSDLETELAYVTRENKRLAEENKKLFIENIALRRQVEH